jgi:hypothetical protein
MDEAYEAALEALDAAVETVPTTRAAVRCFSFSATHGS